MFKAQAQLVSTLFMAVQFFLPWRFLEVDQWSGNALSLLQQHAWREPWPCCVQLRP